MSSTRKLRAVAALISFAVAAVAGWFMFTPPAAERPRVLSALPDKLPSSAVPAQPVASSPAAAVAALERALMVTLDPAAENYRGERLAELCRGDFARDLPGGNAAFSYARRWAKKNPAGMFEWFLKRGLFTLPTREPNHHYSFLNTIWEEWAKRDTASALDAAKRCPRQGDRSDAVVNVIQSLRKTDPARAVAIASENMSSFTNYASYIATDETYRGTWDFLAGLPAGNIRGKMLALFSDGAAHHFDDTLAAWQSLPEGILCARAAGNIAAGAPPERKAEVESIIATLTAADQTIARRAAAAAMRGSGK